ncbi:cell division protein FtsL [Alkalicoccus daliensis]|uniref:Cell division protein FtsL n=1 Tax=Alkalicoccus daliensis TaxID=745820 RepID=A0A1G9ZUF5_9BACI|nr:cell division protein FtsL [Alkalicoccus daliensis]SDN24898.1 cell division protein FtsL [Alkalicoccus daliensis]
MSPLLDQRQHAAEPKRHQTQHVKTRVYKGGITRGEKLIYSLIVPLVIAFGFMIISNYAAIYSLNHELQQTEATIAQQENVNDALSLQVKELSDPERILSIAQTDLGMSLNEEQVQVLHQSN